MGVIYLVHRENQPWSSNFGDLAPITSKLHNLWIWKTCVVNRSVIPRLILGKSNVFEKYTQVVSTEMLGGMCVLDQKFQSKLIPVPQGRKLFCLKEPRRAENYFVWKSPAGSKMKMNQFILSKKSPAGPKIYRYNVFLTSDTNWNNSGSCRENLYVGQNLYVQTPHINLYVGKIYTWKKTFSIYKFCPDFAHI